MAATEETDEPAAEEHTGQRAARTDPVTAVFSRRVSPGHEAEFEDWAHGVIEAATRYPGHLGASVLHEPGSPYYHVVYKFTDRDRFRSWVESDERNRWLAKAERLTEDDPELQETTGMETWFDLPSPDGAPRRPPPRWKMWLVSLLAVYPLVVVFQWLLGPLTEDWPLPLRAALFPLVLLTMMTYVVMPVVTRLLRRLLRRTPEAW